jgi:hypothetical protein
MTNDWDSTFADADKIDGIAASSSPEQQLMLSSLKSTYPISLSKTVGLKAVTALGATTTRAGIISKHYLIATTNDQVVSLDRRMINSPTPNGKLKKSEKTDGYMYVIRICPDNKSTRVMNRDLGARALESDFPEGPSSTRVPVFIGKNMSVFLFSDLRTRRTIANSLRCAVQLILY